ncbi:MAG: tetratricopeptide repeat protein [Patescibacteria group bacterium]|nr:tetratricopeptide repeat protein [Patescibacteria group bacterium]
MFRTIICTLAAIILIATPIFADNLSAAKKFTEAGQYLQAEAVFKAQIDKNAQDADSWYWWGVCQLKQGRTADQLFLKAIGLDPTKYNALASKTYRQEGEAFLAKGRTDTAITMFDGAVSLDKTLKPAIGQYLFNLGQYDLAIRYAPEFGSKAADNLYTKAETFGGEASLPFYRQVKKYSAKYNEAIKAKLLAIAKTKSEEKDITFWRTAAAEFGKIPVDYKIYEPGVYTFSLKAGEKTDHWIMFPARGVVINYSVSSPDYQYKLVYDDGEVIQDGKDVVYPNKITDKFKILAITDQPEIKMTVVQGQLSAVAQQ